MDILDISLDILLKPPQPFIGLFLHCSTENGNFQLFVWLSQRKAQESNKIVEYDDGIARKCFE